MLLETIKAAQLVARKAHDTPTSSLLTTIIGEAAMVGKSAGNRESTDAEVLQVLRKFEKNQVENIRYFTERQKQDAVDYSEFELEIIRSFLPVKLTDLQVCEDIDAILSVHGASSNLNKLLGIVMKELKVKYGDQFDGQQVSAMFKQMLV
jgi:hypothetical protein